jgi:hypothetical protein
MYKLRRIGIAIIFIIISWFALSALKAHLDPNTDNITEEDAEDAAWISTSKYWLDRQSCRWIGICGVAHWHPDPAAKPWTRKRAGEKRDITSEEEEEMFKAEYYDWTDIPDDGERLKPGDWDGDPRVLKDVPQFVLDHAPLIHLYSGEQFWPSDIRKHLSHMDQYTNHTAINETAPRYSLNDIHQLNTVAKGKDLFMHSQEDVEERPDWLGSAYNKPVPYDDEDEEEEEVEEYTEFTSETPEERATWFDLNPASKDNKVAAPFNPTFQAQGQTYRSHIKRSAPMIEKPMPAMPRPGGYSPAPAILVLVDKGHGILDAFWFYFYSYNLGTTVLNMRFGNHVGDWEHSLIRFHNGVPKAVFFSAHSGGIAYSYNAVEKGKGKGREGRPILYSATGSHAMYATPGLHPYVLPFGLLADVTDKGPLWDPALNYLAYHFNTSITHEADAKSFLRPSSNPSSLTALQAQKLSESFQPASSNPKAPVGWWWYKGHWGDKFYELRDERQWRFAGQYHYVNGPLGPRFKNLGRARVCQSKGSCTIVEDISQKRDWLGR